MSTVQKNIATITFCASMVFFFQNCTSQFDAIKPIPDSQAVSSISDSLQIDFGTSSDLINTSDVIFQFDVSVGESTSLKSLSCRLNDRPSTDCMSRSVSFQDLPDGDYSLMVIAESADLATTQKIKVFRKDSTAPVVTISGVPPLIVNQQTAVFIFNVSDNLSGVASVECSLDNGAFVACESPYSVRNLIASDHNLRIRATDKASNPSSIFNHSWKIDLSVPSVILSKTPAAITNLTVASLSFSGAGLISYQCQLDGGNFTACTSPQEYSDLSEKTHIFKVRGTNAAGQVSADLAYSWIIDQTAPSQPILKADVPVTTTLKTASFTFSSTDSGSGIQDFQCSVDAAAFVTCVSPLTLASIREANHSVKVKASDKAGNASLVSSYAWTVVGVIPAPTPAPTATPPNDDAVVGIPSWARAKDYVPPYKKRTNKRYISSAGKNSADGLTPATAWASLLRNATRVPMDTEVIFLDGTYDHTDGSEVYHTRTQTLPDKVTLRAQSYRGVILQGDRSVSGYYAFDVGYARDLEIWGFVAQDWAFSRGAFVNIWSDVDGLRIIGNQGRRNGNEFYDHFIYPSGGIDPAHAIRNVVISHNEVEMRAETGSFIHSFSGTSSSLTNPPGYDIGWRNVEISYNLVTGSCYWGLLQDSHASKNVDIHHNDIRVNAKVDTFTFFSPAKAGGADASYVLRNNIFVNTNPTATVLGIEQPDPPAAPHRPTLKNNKLWNAGTGNGAKVLRNASLGAGDQIIAP